jgi:hypothetical protein
MNVYRLPSGDVRILTEPAAKQAGATEATDAEAGAFFRSTFGRSEPAKEPLTARRAVSGAAGLAAEAFGVGAADRATAEARWATCMTCARFDLGKCAAKGCGCHLSAKVRIARETCPIGRWPENGASVASEPPAGRDGATTPES